MGAADLLQRTVQIADHFEAAGGRVLRAVPASRNDQCRVVQRNVAGQFQVGADGERFFYVSNPALGLWAHRSRFAAS
jgi:hypothetical protein